MFNQKTILFFCLLAISFSSCKKCITCTKNLAATPVCAVCTVSSTNYTTCETDLAGSGYTIDQFIQQNAANGISCVKTGGTGAQTLKEKLCWETDNAHNTAITAQSILEGKGYTCNE